MPASMEVEHKVDKNWKDYGELVLHLKLVSGMRDNPLTYVVRQHIKVTHILYGYHTYLNLDKEIIARDTIVDMKLNFKHSQECLDRAYASWQCYTFKFDNA